MGFWRAFKSERASIPAYLPTISSAIPNVRVTNPNASALECTSVGEVYKNGSNRYRITTWEIFYQSERDSPASKSLRATNFERAAQRSKSDHNGLIYQPIISFE